MVGGGWEDGGRKGVWVQKYGECFEIPAGREDFGFQNRVVSQFLESQKFVLCNSSEGGVRGGEGGKRGRGGGGEGIGGREVGGVLFQNGKKLGRFENLCSYNQVSAAGQVTAKMLMLISNLWRGALVCFGQLFAVGYKKKIASAAASFKHILLNLFHAVKQNKIQ